MDYTKIREFLKGYAQALQDFELPDSDFPLSSFTRMASGMVEIRARDGRHVAYVSVEGDKVSPSMPLGPAAFAYSELFVELANAYMEHRERAATTPSPAAEQEPSGEPGSSL